MTLLLGLLALLALFVFGVWHGARSAVAAYRIDRIVRDDAVFREAERMERDLYSRWWLT